MLQPQKKISEVKYNSKFSKKKQCFLPLQNRILLVLVYKAPYTLPVEGCFVASLFSLAVCKTQMA